MTDHDDLDELPVVYDVQLTCSPPEPLRARYPGMTVHTTQAQTALRRRIDGPQDLDSLLSEIGTVGLTLTDVHRVGATADDVTPSGGSGVHPTPAGPATYEVRVVGELGGPLLRHLGCDHYSVPELTLVRLALAGDELNRFLQVCTDFGARLERVRRVGSGSPACCG